MLIRFEHLTTEQEVTLDTDTLSTLRAALDTDWCHLADILTGYNCDSYADAAESLAYDYDGDIDELIETDVDAYNSVFAYFRVMNGNLTDEQCVDAFAESFSETVAD